MLMEPKSCANEFCKGRRGVRDKKIRRQEDTSIGLVSHVLRGSYEIGLYQLLHIAQEAI